ncbi:MAG: copper resistance protein CopD [Flavobacterium nitrogenifigens]|uniref:copper resistance protein CopD n=1 Tax=Flavobacterium nitrogenifigens TaxID=1617283 RepID=UPI002808FEC0|nr:copper resistance protein CopD [Flavobacterium nitrogenifigens]MDQ8013118.1 copper resistance protein CopD [Flavobacterium nitrogenifigens]
MTLHHFVLILHLLAATIWVGGHLLLAICYLPTALKKKDPQIILNFEKKYEKLGMSSLALLIITGIWMAYDFGIKAETWFHFSSGFEKVVSIKLILLFCTFFCAVCAQFFIIPNLKPNNINKMAVIILTVTSIGVTMLILGSTLRYGGI